MTQPRWLSHPALTGEALKIWRALSRRFLQAETLNADNAHRLVAACRLLAAAQSAGAALEQDGAIIGTEKGDQRANPAFNVVLQAQREAMKLLRDTFEG